MHPIRKKRLTIVLVLLVGISLAVGLITYALRQNINLFYTPTQIAAGEAPEGTRIRAGGLVEEGSVKRTNDSLSVAFRVTDGAQAITITYQGILPDLFREGQGIVALGRVNSEGVLVADEVLAKHDENYVPRELQEMTEHQAAKMAEETTVGLE